MADDSGESISGDVPLTEVPTRKCLVCRGASKPLSEFPIKKGEFIGPNAPRINTCSKCSEQKARVRKERGRKKKHDANKENEHPIDQLEPDTCVDGIGLSNLTLSEFLSTIGAQRASLKLEANVDLSALACQNDKREKADALAQLVWEAMNLRFMWVHAYFIYRIWREAYSTHSHRYQSHYSHKRSAGASARYMYNCAQNIKRQHKSKKIDDPKKQRDKDSLVTFKCGGWLHITLTDLSDICFVKIDHHDDHVPYFPIDIPPDVDEYIRNNTNMTPTQVS